MTFAWQYPVYLVPVVGGYASVIDVAPDGQKTQYLAVFTTETNAVQFTTACGVIGIPSALGNARELSWLLQTLQHPVSHVAFNPDPHSPKVQANWTVSVSDLLANHLVVDLSPWNYPVYVILHQTGFASIASSEKGGNALTAIALFSTPDKAQTYLDQTYLDQAKPTGTIQAVVNLQEAQSLLNGIAAEVTAVALDPTIEEGRYIAPICFAIETILQKYLVVSQNPDAPGDDSLRSN